MYDVVFGVNKNLYPAQAILKAAFAFVDSYYVHIDENPNTWIVQISSKSSKHVLSSIEEEFENELIAQSVRLSVYQKTHHIREILLARAMSSALIVEDDDSYESGCHESDVSDEELSTILSDWFDSHE